MLADGWSIATLNGRLLRAVQPPTQLRPHSRVGGQAQAIVQRATGRLTGPHLAALPRATAPGRADAVERQLEPDGLAGTAKAQTQRQLVGRTRLQTEQRLGSRRAGQQRGIEQ
ncbi:hypothetical protein TMS3_0117725 [Pseudomonas taeanensis MS-3]|uniref:Uncharacterized protein n=1 Tax=Pseudomonas taeanensis MS-3 TaxID=1395571 RepID=A0A0A1YK06_9PSED|nr:hypothetical protein TMS3_0117725 [Pseudomonas taeanensis MS-3]